MSTLRMVVGVVSECEVVIGGVGGGGVRRPTVLRSIRYRRCASMEVVRDMRARDRCPFRLDLRPCIRYCMRIGEFGGVLAIQNVRGRRGDEGGRVGSVRVAY